jgi:hypothetical protein
MQRVVSRVTKPFKQPSRTEISQHMGSGPHWALTGGGTHITR